MLRTICINGGREGERDREKERERQTDRQTHRQTDRQTHRDRETHTKTEGITPFLPSQLFPLSFSHEDGHGRGFSRLPGRQNRHGVFNQFSDALVTLCVGNRGSRQIARREKQPILHVFPVRACSTALP